VKVGNSLLYYLKTFLPFTFLTSALDGGAESAYCSGYFILQAQNPSYLLQSP